MMYYYLGILPRISLFSIDGYREEDKELVFSRRMEGCSIARSKRSSIARSNRRIYRLDHFILKKQVSCLVCCQRKGRGKRDLSSSDGQEWKC